MSRFIRTNAPEDTDSIPSTYAEPISHVSFSVRVLET
jgi:hypothetical protein